MTRQLTAEFFGTLMLLATVVGSGIMAEQLADDTAVALLANTIATGAILYVLITMLGPISGAHFNPAVTLAFLIRGDINAARSAAYVAVQVAGAIVGVWLAHGMFDLDILQTSSKARTGGGQWLAEGVATFGLVSTILLVLVHRAEAVAMSVGLYITAAYWFTASTSFANPAVTVARALTDTFAGIQPEHVIAFVVCQLVAAAGAAVFCRWLAAK